MARINDKNRDDLYRVYTTDALRIISENTSKLGGGSYMSVRYADIIQPKKEKDTRTGDEIAADIITKIARKGVS